MSSRVPEEAYELNVNVTEGISFFGLESGSAAMEGISVSGLESGSAVAEGVSFFRLEGGHVVLETCKPAFDRKDGVVLRLYESRGCAGKTILHVPEHVMRIYECNMLEEVGQELKLSEEGVELVFHAFEIKTLLLIVSGERSGATKAQEISGA